MTAEGWNGKTLRQLFEEVASEAAEARSLAESAHDEIATLRAELATALAKGCKDDSDGGAAK
jgi:hypothetical protein